MSRVTSFCRVFKHVLQPSRTLLKAEPLYVTTIDKRYLFSHDRLGLENFKRNKSEYHERMGNLKERFCKEVDDFMSQKDAVVFTADLKTMVHLAEDERDLSLLTSMIHLYQKQQTDLSFAQFNFGPLVMRLLYLMDKPDVALKLFTDEDLSKSGFFDQMTSQVIIMDMLFEQERYDDMHHIMALIGQRQLAGVKFPMDCVTLALAACLKQNTDDSYQKMLSYIKGCQESGQNLSHRAITYAILLALKQERNNEAVEMLSLAPIPFGRRRQPKAMQNIKLLAYSKVNKVEEALLLLRSVLENDVPHHVKTGGEIFTEVLAEVEKCVEASDSKELKQQFIALQRGLDQGGHLMDTNFENFTFRTIISNRSYQDGYKQRQANRKLGQARAIQAR